MKVFAGQDDIADIAIEDLRKWKQWGETGFVLGLAGKETHADPLVKRAILRFALSAAAEGDKDEGRRVRGDGADEEPAEGEGRRGTARRRPAEEEVATTLASGGRQPPQLAEHTPRPAGCAPSSPVLLLAAPACACSVCGGSLAGKTTLREQYSQAAAVVAGTLKNPKPDPKGIGGSTEFHFAKPRSSPPPSVEGKTALVVPHYFPVVGQTPPDYLFFLDDVDGKAVVGGGVPSSAAVVDYLKAVAQLDPKDTPARLAFYFKHLDAADPTVSADAFLEFAKAADADLSAAKAKFDPTKLAKWMADPKTPEERLGVYAALLGLCGEAKHTKVFAALLREPLAERVQGNLAGVFSGYALLDAPAGWKAIRGQFADPKAAFDRKLAALSAVRFLQAGRPKEMRAGILGVYADLLADADAADLVIDDLRRWGWWDKTADVLAVWGTPAGGVKEVRKAVLRYALACPEDAAKRFVAAARKEDAKLVERVEGTLK